jgi:hypothetical protein
MAADNLRQRNWSYRNLNFCPARRMPGFIGHQTERYYPNGTLALSDYLLRDFDLLGFPYSLLSSISTAGMNNVHCNIGGRDEAESALLPAAFKQMWRQWLLWTDAHMQHLHNARPILAAPAAGAVDGMTLPADDGSHTFVFVFNPNYFNASVTLTIDVALGLSGDASSLFTVNEVYPLSRQLLTGVGWGNSFECAVSGSSVRVLYVTSEPVVAPALFGAAGSAQWVGADGAVLELVNVTGEAGTAVRLHVALSLVILTHPCAVVWLCGVG